MKNQINTVGAIATIGVIGLGIISSVSRGKADTDLRKIAMESLTASVAQDQIDHLLPLEEKFGPLVSVKDARVVLKDMSPADGAQPYFSAFVVAQFEKKPELLKVLLEKDGSRWTVSDISGTELPISNLTVNGHFRGNSNPA